MASPIQISAQQWLNLKVMATDLLPKYEFRSHYGDGIITFQDRMTLKKAEVHWYELVFDLLLPALSRREAERKPGSDWGSILIGYMNTYWRERVRLALGRHPADFAFEKFQQILLASPQQRNTSIG